MNDEIELLLKEVDNDFVPPLSSRLNLSSYVSKITEKATIFSVHENNRLSAFIAIYCNDLDSRVAYLTMMAVSKQCRGRGLALSLLKTSFQYLETMKFNYLKLEVYKNNKDAIAIYQRFGFKIVDETDTSYFMNLNIL